ncbi:Calx-beta domain-containing protein, partial [Chloroflexota bacterium]
MKRVKWTDNSLTRLRWLSVFLLVTLLVSITVPVGTVSRPVLAAPTCVVTHLDLTPSGGSATTGTPFNVTVTIYYDNGGRATNYTGTVRFSSTDGSANLPGDYQFTLADAGRHTFSVTLNTAGSQDVTARDIYNSSLTDTETWIVSDEPEVSFTSASQSGSEDIVSMTVTAQLDKASTLDVSVPFTLSGSATQGTSDDYTITASPITIAAGNLSTNITISVNDDAIVEPDETVIITMGTPTNANK